MDQTTAEHFALTINQLKGRVGMVFITHAMPKNLQVDEIVRIGKSSLGAVGTAKGETPVPANARPETGQPTAQVAAAQATRWGPLPQSQEQKTEGRMEA